jgi:tetratricopeptide (TPR) repeat protein
MVPFDVYHKWLGIPPSEQPPNQYRLLGVSLFESDPEVIDAAANRQMSYVQGFANSEHAAASQAMLNELSEARLCLLDPWKKSVYDETMGRPLAQSTLANPTPRQTLARIEVSPADLGLLMRQAKEALVQSRWDVVIDMTSQVIRNDPKRVGAYLLRAEALRKQSRADRALADLAVAIRLDPQSPHPHVIRAGIFKKQVQFDQAIAEATQAIFLDSDSAAAYAVRFECRSLIGDQEGASQDAEELFRIDPTRQVGSAPNGVQEPRGGKPVGEVRTNLAKSRRRIGDGSEIYADDKPVDRSLNLRKPVSADEVAESLVDASDYRPVVMPSPLPTYRSVRRIRRSSALTVVMLCVGVGVIGGIVWYANRAAPNGPSGSDSTVVESSDQPSNEDKGPIAANLSLPETATYLLDIAPAAAQLSVKGEGANLIESDGVNRISVEKPNGTRSIVLAVSLDGYEPIERTLTPMSGSKETVKLSLERRFFLSDLQEVNVETENGWFGKHGKLGIGPEWEEKEIVVGGIISANGVSMHAKSDDYSTISYNIDRQYSTFVSTAALHDAIQDDSRTPLVFEVRGDGRLLWQSKRIQHAGENEICRVNVDGVNRLELRVRCPGPCYWAQSVWVEPYLLMRASSSEPWGQSDRRKWRNSRSTGTPGPF